MVVVLSRSRSAEHEVFLEHCAADRVPVVVRPSGGGAVLLAPGVVTASAVLRPRSPERFPEALFRRLGSVVAGALAACGVDGVTMRGVSDLCLGDRKVVGSSLRLWADRALYQASVLVALEVDLLGRYLRMPTRAPSYRAGRDHRQFVTTLAAAGHAVAARTVAESLRRAFATGELT